MQFGAENRTTEGDALDQINVSTSGYTRPLVNILVEENMQCPTCKIYSVEMERLRTENSHLVQQLEEKNNLEEQLKKQISYLSLRLKMCESNQRKQSNMKRMLVAMQETSLTEDDAYSKLPSDLQEQLRRLEHLIGPDYYNLGNALGISNTALEKIDNDSSLDLGQKTRYVLRTWTTESATVNPKTLQGALETMDRDINLVEDKPLSLEEVQILRDERHYFCRHITDVAGVCDRLIEKRILTESSVNFIMSGTDKNRCGARLCCTVQYMGSDALIMLCQALEQCGENHIAERIRRKIDSTPGLDKKDSGDDVEQ